MELLCQHDDPDTAVFYTVWSYKRGYGRTITNSAEELKDGKIKKAVTLSPLTTMAERFHIRNGAKLIGKYEHCQTLNIKYQNQNIVDNEDTKGTRMDDNWYYFKKEE